MKALLSEKVYVVNVLGTFFTPLVSGTIVTIELTVMYLQLGHLFVQTIHSCPRLHCIQLCHWSLFLLGSEGWS